MFRFNDPAWRRRAVVMVFGIVLMGVGISLFKLSLMGNDPSSAMVMAVGARLGLPFSIMLILSNCLWFVLEVIFGRSLIGLGTFVNWFCVGLFTDLWTVLITAVFPLPNALPGRVAVMGLGVLVLSFSVSLYQTAALGIAPYDALSILLAKYLPIPYFWCRIFTDSMCTVVAFLFGGIIGAGTLVCALGLGPFINYFSTTVAQKFCGLRPRNVP